MKVVALSALCLAALAVSPVIANAQDAHHQHHGTGMNLDERLPTETGQSAFAAIAEIVTILGGETDTDWNSVDIDALRAHLVDMNELTLNADVETGEENETIVFKVTGTDRTLEAIRAMVPAHAEMLRTEVGWDTAVEMLDAGVQLSVSARDPRELAMFRGLGFFGIMATGGHHQEHHLAIARGEMKH